MTTSGQEVSLVGSDVPAGAATIHLIDEVLLPAGVVLSGGDTAPAPAPAA